MPTKGPRASVTFELRVELGLLSHLLTFELACTEMAEQEPMDAGEGQEPRSKGGELVDICAV